MPCMFKPSVHYPMAELVQQVHTKTWPCKHLIRRHRQQEKFYQRLDSEVDSVVPRHIYAQHLHLHVNSHYKSRSVRVWYGYFDSSNRIYDGKWYMKATDKDIRQMTFVTREEEEMHLRCASSFRLKTILWDDRLRETRLIELRDETRWDGDEVGVWSMSVIKLD